MPHMKEIAGKYFKGKKLHVVSNCTIRYDVTGRCIDWEVRKDELILKVEVNGKILEVGENQRLVDIKVL